jgi:hypothetical protein
MLRCNIIQEEFYYHAGCAKWIASCQPALWLTQSRRFLPGMAIIPRFE